MKTTKAQLREYWASGNISHVCEILKRTSKLNAMDFAVLIALTDGAEAAGRLLSSMAACQHGLPITNTENERN
jgi:hypothetical protein